MFLISILVSLQMFFMTAGYSLLLKLQFRKRSAGELVS
jgi:hypothetical protein